MKNRFSKPSDHIRKVPTGFYSSRLYLLQCIFERRESKDIHLREGQQVKLLKDNRSGKENIVSVLYQVPQTLSSLNKYHIFLAFFSVCTGIL